MRFSFLGIMIVFSMMSCMDKPTGESDDPSVEINELVFDDLSSTDQKPQGDVIYSDEKSTWKSKVYQQGNTFYFEITMPSSFEIPMDPDAPDTLPAKIKQVWFTAMISDDNGNTILEQRCSGDLKSTLVFIYDLPDLAFRSVSKGNRKLHCQTAMGLNGVQGTRVGNPVSEISFHWNRWIPPIFKTTVNFSEFRLSDGLYEKSSHNNDGLGNPLPDMFWTFKADGMVNFKSSTYENSNPYFVEKLTFNFFHVQKDPSITIEIWDDDYTSLNDKLAEWKGKLSQLPKQSGSGLNVKGLDFFKLVSDKSVISNP